QAQDFGVILLEPNADGKRIQDVVGGQGIAFHGTVGQGDTVLQLGYPGLSQILHIDTAPVEVMKDADGSRLYVSVYRPFDSLAPQSWGFSGTKPTLDIETLWEGGASGGPVIANLDPTTGHGQIMGVIARQGRWLNEYFTKDSYFDDAE